MTSLALALLLAQLAQPAPGGLAYPLGADLAAPGAVYQLGPTGQPSLSWTPAVGVYTSPITPTKGPQLTFTRASSGSYVVTSGTVNAVQAPTQLASSPWTGTNSGASAIAASNNAATAPDGTTTAAQLVLPAVSSGQYSVRGVTGTLLPAGSYTWSIQLRAASGSASTYVYAYNNTDGAYLGNSLCSLTTTWSTCSVGFTIAATKTVNLWVGTDASPGSGMSATSSATVYAWGASVPVPGSVAWAETGRLRVGSQGALLEPARTNLVLRNTEYDHAAWGKYGVGASAPSVSANAGAAPDGTATADQIAWPSGVTVAQASILEPAVGLTVTTGQPYTWSVWLRAASGTASVYLSFDNGTGPVQPTLITATTAWTQYSITRTIGAGDLGTGGKLYPEIAIDRRGGVESDQGGPVLLVWGAVLEQGEYATSVSLTAGTSVTRAADVLSVADSVLGSGSASVHFVLTPEWASSVDATLLASTTPNELGLATVAGALDFTVGGNDISTGALGWSAGTAQTLDAWYTPGGAWRVTDGTHTASGVSAATPSTGGTLYLGGSSSAGAGVALSQVKVCKRAGVCR